MERELVPIRSRAREVAANGALVKEMIEAGADHARRVAQATMREVKDRMGLT